VGVSYKGTPLRPRAHQDVPPDRSQPVMLRRMNSMQIEIQVGTLTPEQEALRERYEQAASILRGAGFDAKVIGLCVFSPSDRPAHIVLEP